jgi:hypothetical protein
VIERRKHLEIPQWCLMSQLFHCALTLLVVSEVLRTCVHVRRSKGKSSDVEVTLRVPQWLQPAGRKRYALAISVDSSATVTGELFERERALILFVLSTWARHVDI